MATSLHGAISAHEHPNAAGKLARANTADDIIGNRVYGAWGVGDDGVLTILDRKKLLPPPTVVVAVRTWATLTSRRKLTCWPAGRDPLHVAGSGRPHARCRCSG